MENEIWKDIQGYEGLYQVSNNGGIRSLSPRYFNKKDGSKNISQCNSIGYKVVKLIKNKTQKTIKVHRLIAQSFIPNPENKPCINHKNGIRSDNRLDNLEWCTFSENTKHAYDTGLAKGLKGSDSFSAKLTESEVINIRLMRDKGESQENLAKMYGTTTRNISALLLGKSWKHLEIKGNKRIPYKQSGSLNNGAKLTEEKVLSIMQRLNLGDSLLSIANEFGTTKSNISCIRLGKSWSHVTGIKKRRSVVGLNTAKELLTII